MKLQIVNSYTKNKVIEFNSKLYTNGRRLLDPKARIECVAVDFSDANNTVTVLHNLDPQIVSVLTEMIIQQRIDFFKSGFSEQKINVYKKMNDKYFVSKFTIKYNEKMNNPWNITVENGKGDMDKKENGLVNIKNYEEDKKVSLFLSNIEMLKIAIALKDFINAFKIVHMREVLQQTKNNKTQQNTNKNVKVVQK